MRMNRSLVDMQRGRLDEVMADLAAAEAAYRAAGLSLEAEPGGPQSRLRPRCSRATSSPRCRRCSRCASRWMRSPSSGPRSMSSTAPRSCARRVSSPRPSEPRERRRWHSAGIALRASRPTADYHLARSLLSHDPEHAALVAAASRAAIPARRKPRLGRPRGGHPAAGTTRRRADRPSRDAVRVPPAAPAPRRQVEDVVQELRAAGFVLEADALRLTDRAGANPAARGRDGARRLQVRERGRRSKWRCWSTRCARPTPPGRPREAEVRRHAARGLDLLERTQLATGSLDLQASAAMRGAGLIMAGLSSAVRSRRHEVVFEWSERARHLNQQVVPVRPPPDPALAADLAELRMLRSAEPDGDWLADPAGRRAARPRARAPMVGHRGGVVAASAACDEARATLAPTARRSSPTSSTGGASCALAASPAGASGRPRLARGARRARRRCAPTSTCRHPSAPGRWPRAVRAIARRSPRRAVGAARRPARRSLGDARADRPDRARRARPGCPWTMLPGAARRGRHRGAVGVAMVRERDGAAVARPGRWASRSGLASRAAKRR